MQAFNPRTLLYPVFAALIAVGAVSTPVLAAPANAKAAKAEKKTSSPQDMQIELQKIGTQLGQIERKAVAGSPKLQAKRRHFSEHMVKVMKKLGYTPDADIKKLAAIKKNILSGKLKKDERMAQIKKFRDVRLHLMKGQMAALQDKSLIQERQKLNEATMLAMKKTDPHTEDLIKRFNAISAKLRSMRQSQGSQAHH